MGVAMLAGNVILYVPAWPGWPTGSSPPARDPGSARFGADAGLGPDALPDRRRAEAGPGRAHVPGAVEGRGRRPQLMRAIRPRKGEGDGPPLSRSGLQDQPFQPVEMVEIGIGRRLGDPEPGKRRNRVGNAMRSSIRASGAPTQKWMPGAEARMRLHRPRSGSKRAGSGQTAGSRFAAASSSADPVAAGGSDGRRARPLHRPSG